MRVLKAVLVGLVVGVAVAAAVNSVPWWDPFRFWGLFFGSFAGVATFGLALHRHERGATTRIAIGRWIAALTLLVFGGLVASWIVMWDLSPFTLEGAWIYPLALLPLIVAGMLLKPRRPKKEGWADPPSREVGTPS